jgi:hypothetical protein
MRLGRSIVGRLDPPFDEGLGSTIATGTVSPIGLHRNLDRSTRRPGRSEEKPRADK